MGYVCGHRQQPSDQPHMGTAFTPAKTSPASWDAFSDVDALVDSVLAELAAMAADWPALRHPIRHAVHAVRPLDPAWSVAPPAQPLDPGLAAGLRRYCGTQRRHCRQPVVSLNTDLLRPRLRRRQEDQGHQDP